MYFYERLKSFKYEIFELKIEIEELKK